MVTRRQWYRWRPISVVLVLHILALSALAGRGVQAASTCQVTYTIVNQWVPGFQASVDIKNTGTTTINGWTLAWAFPNGQTIYQLWNGNYTQSGANVSVTNLSWNASIAPGATVNVGFNANWSGTNNIPSSFTLNGVVCTGGSGGPTNTPTRTNTPTNTPTRTPTPSITPTPGTPTPTPIGGNAYTQRFLAQYNKIKDPANGYFSPQGVPYHSIETLMVEAPDYGHETTSEAFSYWIWLEAMYGQVTGDWTHLDTAWSTMERYIIPSAADQPIGTYDPSSPATYAREHATPDLYPSALNSSARAGQDPLYSELQSTYGTKTIYGMHWLLDVDNWYGYGHCGDGTTKPAYINTFQRGAQESVWETVAHPSCETFNWGKPNEGFLTLFIAGSAAKQWRYTDAPDADARAIQAIYWAKVWADQRGGSPIVNAIVAKAAKMGDYLRYSFFDKYFKQIGNCIGETTCPAGTGKNSAHYLLSWYYAWGGALDGSWSWRIGSSHNHFGYQNPLAAYVLSSVPAFKPLSPTAQQDWTTSLQRQLEFYRWLQSSEGAIAGGATNSWGGNYGTEDPVPAGLPTFYGMFYDFQPVYHDPPSNQWFGFQAWSMERVAEYYNVTGNATAKALLDKWVAWARSQTTLTTNSYQIPSTLGWSGQPDTWNPSNPGSNAGLHVTVVDRTNDVGVAAAYAKTLMYYAARSGDTASRDLAKGLLDRMWANFQDSKGVALPETRTDYNRFDDPFNASTHSGVFIPPGWTGTNAQGATLNSSTTFLSERPKYTQDPAWPQVQAYLNGGPAPTFTYHRFWAQSDIALAMADFGRLFPNQ